MRYFACRLAVYGLAATFGHGGGGVIFCLALVCAAMIFCASPACAMQYESRIEIDSEDDLVNLVEREEISADTFQNLVDLFQNPIDLNAASREDIYELPELTFAQVDQIIQFRQEQAIFGIDDLVHAGIITKKKSRSIAPFVLASQVGSPVSGEIEGKSRFVCAASSSDGEPPPTLWQARVQERGLRLRGGWTTITTRRQLGAIRFDPRKEALVAEPARYALHLAKIFSAWDWGRYSVLVGSFRAGFGQRLTLDNTARALPNHFYPDEAVKTSVGDLGKSSGIGDFAVNNGFRGIAASASAEIGRYRLTLHGFGSYQTRSATQYEIYDRRRCRDPRSDNDARCRAPTVLIGQTPAVHATLPDIYDELAGGGNVTIAWGDGNHLGFTGYGARDRFRISGMALDFQEWSTRPFGGPFAAIGVDAAWRVGKLRLFAEVARSLNSAMQGGGGIGAFHSAQWDVLPAHVIKWSLRYYDKKFINPLGRPAASANLYQGQRARNELGARLHYTYQPERDFAWRTQVDASTNPKIADQGDAAKQVSVQANSRVDFAIWKASRVSFWTEYRKNNPARQDDDRESDEQDSPAKKSWRLVARTQVELVDWRLLLALQYQHRMTDGSDKNRRLRQGASVWSEASIWLVQSLRLRWRTHYLRDDFGDIARSQQLLSTVLEVTWRTQSPRSQAHLRYDFKAFLDQRDSTLARASPVAHGLQLNVEVSF